MSSSAELKENLINENKLHTESERGIMKVISIVNQKVGIEKTAIAVNLINLNRIPVCKLIIGKGWISDERTKEKNQCLLR